MFLQKHFKHWPDSLGGTLMFFFLSVIAIPAALLPLAFGAYWVLSVGMPSLTGHPQPAWLLGFAKIGFTAGWVGSIIMGWKLFYDETISVAKSANRFDQSIQRDFGITAEEWWANHPLTEDS